MSEKTLTSDSANRHAQTVRREKIAYQRPQLIRYGELASLTQSGPTISTAEFFTTYGPVSN